MRPCLSVAIPSVGRWDRLRLTLASLDDALDGIPSSQVILSLEGAGEVPQDVCRAVQAFPGSEILVSASRHGRAANRNRCLAVARGETVCFLDEDMVCRPGWARAHLDAQTARPGVVAGPVGELIALAPTTDLERLTGADGAVARRGRAVLAALEAGFDACWSRHAVRQPLQRLAAQETSLVWVGCSGANLSVHRDALGAAAFDKRAGVAWGLEDLAFALTALQRAAAVSTAEDAKALHLTHPQPDWREAQRGNACLLDALKPALRGPALAVIESRGAAEAVARWSAALAGAGALFDA